MTRSFGLPLPEEGANTTWWLRLNGVRDVAAGLAVLACIAWAGPRVVGIVLLAGLFMWAALWLRDAQLRALLPFRKLGSA